MDFDDFLDIHDIVIPKEKEKANNEFICCNQKMSLDNSSMICFKCGRIVEGEIMDYDYNNQANTGISSNKTSMKITKVGANKHFIIYPAYQIEQENRLKAEFKSLKEQGGIPDDIINTALYNYNQLITNNKIVKKKNHKKGIQIAFIWIEYENRGIPRTKSELVQLFQIKENILTKGYNFVFTHNFKFSLDLIKVSYGLDIIHDFIKRFYSTEDYKIERFLFNMGNIIKDNPILHQDKHPRTLALAIILYASEIYKFDFDLDQFVEKQSTVKNIKAYCKFLKSHRDNKESKAYFYFNQIIDAFKI